MAQDITSMEQLGTILELTKDELEWKESPISVPLRITARPAQAPSRSNLQGKPSP